MILFHDDMESGVQNGINSFRRHEHAREGSLTSVNGSGPSAMS